MTTLQETRQQAKNIIRNGLDAQFQGKLHFREIRITPRSGANDEEYLDIQVIYDGKPADLNPRLLNSLYCNIEDDLRAIGISEIPSLSYRERSEDDHWAKTTQKSWSREQT